jgi:hypothetical protein
LLENTENRRVLFDKGYVMGYNIIIKLLVPDGAQDNNEKWR